MLLILIAVAVVFGPVVALKVFAAWYIAVFIVAVTRGLDMR